MTEEITDSPPSPIDSTGRSSRDSQPSSDRSKPAPEAVKVDADWETASDTPAAATSKGSDRRRQDPAERALGDFTTTPAILRLVPLAS